MAHPNDKDGKAHCAAHNFDVQFISMRKQNRPIWFIGRIIFNMYPLTFPTDIENTVWLMYHFMRKLSTLPDSMSLNELRRICTTVKGYGNNI